MIAKSGTPVERYDGILVKRDDLCCDDPGMAKVRGLERFVLARPSVERFGILDGRHSRNGWALARVCSDLGRTAVVYYPRRKADTDEGETRTQARRLGADIRPIRAGRSAIVYAAAIKDFGSRTGMVANAVKIPETVDAHADEVESQASLWRKAAPDRLVIPCGTGTIAAGVIRGMGRIGVRPEVVLVLAYPRSEAVMRRYVSGLSDYPDDRVRVVTAGTEYGGTCKTRPPFPACPHYEAFAWEWAVGNRTTGETVVWNAGD